MNMTIEPEYNDGFEPTSLFSAQLAFVYVTNDEPENLDYEQMVQTCTVHAADFDDAFIEALRIGHVIAKQCNKKNSSPEGRWWFRSVEVLRRVRRSEQLPQESIQAGKYGSLVRLKIDHKYRPEYVMPLWVD